ncbi:MAG TPA: TRAP transporter large permease subunit, partial [Hyphomicrobiaceae bacterium]|nr:TRAP transporter large permease subunit [Hyphomicrobiaceae bacterium]
TMKSDILPAVPLFIFMGYMTEQAGLMERLFVAMRSIMAPVRGALYLAVILTATIFAMATGIVGAAVTVLGIMAGPIMIKSGYDARLSSGAIAAGGTLGILIPPSVMLVVMGPTMGVPVNLLYKASIGPGLLLAGMYIAYCLIRSFINPSLGPPMSPEERRVADDTMMNEQVSLPVRTLGFAATVLLAPAVVALVTMQFLGWEAPIAIVKNKFVYDPKGLLVLVLLVVSAIGAGAGYIYNAYFRAICIGIAPLAALIATTLGTIVGGLATPTEAASCGAFGASLLALVYGKLTLGDTSRPLFVAASLAAAVVGGIIGWTYVGGVSGTAFGAIFGGTLLGFILSPPLYNAGMGTMTTSAMVLFLAVASNIFGAVFAKLGTASVITNGLIALPLPDLGKLALIMLIIFLLGWPFEWPAIILVFLPIFLPVFDKLQIAGLTKLEMLLWFGALVAVNLQTAFLSPPVAMSAYYLRNVVPQWSLATIYRGMADYMVIQIICLLLLFFFPALALFGVR